MGFSGGRRCYDGFGPLGFFCCFCRSLVFGCRLTSLERLVHILGGLVGLVGLALIVDGILRLAFPGDTHHLVAVGIYAGGFRLTLFGIVLEIDGGSFVTSSFAASRFSTAIGSYPARVSKPDISRRSESEASTMSTLFIVFVLQFDCY